MTFKLLSQEEFIQHTSASSQRSFMQTVEMAELLSKRGFSTQYVGYTDPQGLDLSSNHIYGNGIPQDRILDRGRQKQANKAR